MQAISFFYNVPGNWSYNSATKKLTLIYDYDDEPNYEAAIPPMIALSSTKCVIGNEDGDQYKYVKK